MSLTKCNSCPNHVDRYYVSPASGGKYCCDCWDAIHPPRSKEWLSGIFVIDRNPRPDSPFIHVATGGTTVTTFKKETQAEMFGYLECGVCKYWRNEGEYAGKDWICSICLKEDNDPDCEVLPAKVHFSAKPKGNKVAIEYFDFMMMQLDSDWPSPTKNPPICKECGGTVWTAPTLTPKQLKQLAQECGVGKLKIRYWGASDKCEKVVV